MIFSDIDLKAASKFLGSRFACGASITGDDEIVIQGDCVDDLFDVLPDKWSQVIRRSQFAFIFGFHKSFAYKFMNISLA